MIRLFRWCFIPLLLVATAAPASRQAESVQQFRLDNGLTLLVVERHDAPTVAAYITLGVGSVHEESDYRGVAHLLEHMLFKGTTTLGTTDYAAEEPLLERIEEVGSRLDALRLEPTADPAELAELERQLEELQRQHQQYVVKDELSKLYAENGGVGYNAFTSKDLTTYLVSLPSNKLELWAAMESDRMKNPVLREFYTEREVIREERRRSYESSPGGLIYETLLTTAFNVHPYRNPIIGWDSDIRNLTLAETRAFLSRYYAPVNTVIALVGDVTAADALALVERYFGSILPGTPVPTVAAVEPPQRGERRATVDFDSEPTLAIAYHKPTLPDRDDYVFDVLSQILGEGRTSRLYRALVEERQIAAGVSTYMAPGSRFPHLFVISVTPRFPHTLDEVEAAVYAELDRLVTEGVSATELERTRNRLSLDQLRYLRGNGGLARLLTHYQIVAGDWRYMVDYDEVIRTVTAEEVRAAAASYFVPANRTVVRLQRSEEGVQ